MADLPQSEDVIFQAQEITITKTRALIGTQTFAIANVTSVNIGRNDPSPWMPLGCLAFGAILLVSGIATAISASRASASEGTATALGGAFFLVMGWLWLKSNKPTWVLILRTAGSEMRVLTSKDKELIGKAAAAVSSAIVARG